MAFKGLAMKLHLGMFQVLPTIGLQREPVTNETTVTTFFISVIVCKTQTPPIGAPYQGGAQILVGSSRCGPKFVPPPYI